MMKIVYLMLLIISIGLVSCEKDDNLDSISDNKVEKKEFIPLPVRVNIKENPINIMTGEKNVSASKALDFEMMNFKMLDGHILKDFGNGFVEIGTYSRLFSIDDCYPDRGNCLPSVNISSMIENNGSNDDISQEQYDFIKSEYCNPMGEIVDGGGDPELASNYYFNAHPNSVHGKNLHDFLNYNAEIQEQIFNQEITFMRFENQLFVVYTGAEDPSDCPEYFFDEEYDIQNPEL